MTEEFPKNSADANTAENKHTAAARDPLNSCPVSEGRQLAFDPRNSESTKARTPSRVRKAARNRNRTAFVRARKDRRRSAEVDQLARILVPNATGRTLILARNVVAAEIDLRRLEAARANLIRRESAKLDAKMGARNCVNLRTNAKGTQVKLRDNSHALARTIFRVGRELFQFKRSIQRARARKTRAIRLLRKHLIHSPIESKGEV